MAYIPRDPFEVGDQPHISKFYSFFTSHYEKGFFFEGEMHDFWECVYIIDGKMQVSADDRTYELTSGDIIFHKPLEFHNVVVTAECGVTHLTFSFNFEGNLKKKLMEHVFHLDDEEKKIITDLMNFLKNNAIDAPTSIVPLSNLCHSRQSFITRKTTSPIYYPLICSHLYQLFLMLAYKEDFVHTIHNAETELYRNVVRYIKNNLHQNLSITDIAQANATSESTLNRLFNKFAGMSTHKYFLNMRLNESIKLLKSGMRVSEVTNTLNFSSQSYFSSMFKRETGVSPTSISKE